MASSLDNPFFRQASWLLLVFVVLASLASAIMGRWCDAAVLAGFVVLGALFMWWQDELPRLFTLLFLLAGLINATGYMFDLWHGPVWFDEAAHFYTSFTIMAGLGWFALARTRLAGRSFRFVAAVTALRLVLGILWEVFGYIMGIIGGRHDTIMDFAMDTLGVIAAGLFCA